MLNEFHVFWSDLKVGEFIYGYLDEDGFVSSNEVVLILCNGLFMVYCKFE